MTWCVSAVRSLPFSFCVADVAKRGLMSWDDFVVFQTLFRRPDATRLLAHRELHPPSRGRIPFAHPTLRNPENARKSAVAGLVPASTIS
jgi:hypothetical protein